MGLQGSYSLGWNLTLVDLCSPVVSISCAPCVGSFFSILGTVGSLTVLIRGGLGCRMSRSSISMVCGACPATSKQQTHFKGVTLHLLARMIAWLQWSKSKLNLIKVSDWDFQPGPGIRAPNRFNRFIWKCSRTDPIISRDAFWTVLMDGR
jgi:hypothetical protein